MCQKKQQKEKKREARSCVWTEGNLSIWCLSGAQGEKGENDCDLHQCFSSVFSVKHSVGRNSINGEDREKKTASSDRLYGRFPFVLYINWTKRVVKHVLNIAQNWTPVSPYPTCIHPSPPPCPSLLSASALSQIMHHWAWFSHQYIIYVTPLDEYRVQVCVCICSVPTYTVSSNAPQPFVCTCRIGR